jgi:hypothetical protein
MSTEKLDSLTLVDEQPPITVPNELLLGVMVECGRRCRRCGHSALVITRLRVGPHAAALNCPDCDQFADWASRADMYRVIEHIQNNGPAKFIRVVGEGVEDAP